jgi:hypothetical protein
MLVAPDHCLHQCRGTMNCSINALPTPQGLSITSCPENLAIIGHHKTAPRIVDISWVNWVT